jgi:hypothetical protein
LRESTVRSHDWQSAFPCGYCPKERSKARLRFSRDGERFLATTAACCIHYFQGFTRTPCKRTLSVEAITRWGDFEPDMHP